MVDFRQKLDEEIVRVANLLRELRSCKVTLERLDKEAEALLSGAPAQSLTARVKALFDENPKISTSEAICQTRGKPTSVSHILSRLRREAATKTGAEP